MEDRKTREEGDVRVPLIYSFFCLCVLAGGIFLVLYVFFPNLSEPWFPIPALLLIGSPWIFWLFTYLYTWIKACFAGPEKSPKGPTYRQNTRTNEMQQRTASSKDSESPLTTSAS